jgi:hypothetical protein
MKSLSITWVEKGKIMKYMAFSRKLMRRYSACLKNATCYLVAKAHKWISKGMLTLAVAKIKSSLLLPLVCVMNKSNVLFDCVLNVYLPENRWKIKFPACTPWWNVLYMRMFLNSDELYFAYNSLPDCVWVN